MDKVGWDKFWSEPVEALGNGLFHRTKKIFSVPVAERNLRDIVSVFDKNKVTYWLGFGTLLGCVRDNALLEHDHDMDFFCYSDEFQQISHTLKDLEGLEFKIIRVWRLWTLLSIIREEVCADILLFNSKGKGVYQNASWRMYPKDLVLIKKEFLGIDVSIPKNYEVLLKRWYGENWQTPVKGLGPKVEHRK